VKKARHEGYRIMPAVKDNAHGNKWKLSYSGPPAQRYAIRGGGDTLI
jgi:hypothetical protein